MSKFLAPLALFSLIALLTTSCTQVFYQPTSQLYSDPAQLGLEFENIYLTTDDGVRLHGWFFPSKKTAAHPSSKGLILFFHGNAQNITSHYANLFWIVEQGWDFFIFDYRGYGLSESTASQQGVHQDALAALKLSHQWVEDKSYPKFIVYGQSLGGTIAARALQDDPLIDRVDLIVFDSTFPSYRKIARHKLKQAWMLSFLRPLTPLLISDEYSPESFYPQIKNPVLVIHGERDNIVEYQFGKEIYEMLTTEKKWFWSLKEGQHIDVFFNHDQKYRQRFVEFLNNDFRESD